MRKKLYLYILLTLFAVSLQAQNLSVTAKILDKNDKPLRGVMVITPDKSAKAHITDAEGLATFEALKGDKIQFVLVNEYSKTMIVDEPFMTVKLDYRAKQIDLGFNNVVTKEKYTGSVTTITSDDLDISGQLNPENALYGRMPGLMVLQGGNNLPWDDSPSFKIRGRGGYLIVVDGFERNLYPLVREEIESISVIKDAASLALYGARGANGVILVTTKQGTNKPLRAKINYEFGLQTPIRLPKMADAPTYARAMNEALQNDNLSPLYSKADIADLESGAHPYLFPNVDWFDEALRSTANTNELNLSFDGSGDKIRYYTLLNYASNNGFLKNTDINKGYSTQIQYYRLNVRTNLDIDITKMTKVKINLLGHIYQKNEPGSGASDIFNSLYTVPSAAFPIRSANGMWARNSTYDNPIARIAGRGYLVTQQRTLLADVSIRQDLSVITKGLSAEVAIGYDNMANYSDDKIRTYAYEEIIPVRNSEGVLMDSTVNRYGADTGLEFETSLSYQKMITTIRGKLNYEKEFGKDQLNVALIYNQDKMIYSGQNQTFMYRSIAADISYDLRSKYLFNLSMSYYGSSVLPKNDKYRFYPAVSAAWIISNENFMKSVNAIDYLKLRASYGLIGISHSNYDLQKQFYNLRGGGSYYFGENLTLAKGTSEGDLAIENPDFGKDYKANVGIEMNAFKGLSLEVDGFYSHRTNLSVGSWSVISSVIGIGLPSMNVGITNDYGVDVALGWRDRVNEDFSYYVNGMLSFYKSKIIEMNEEYRPYDNLIRTNHASGQYFGLKAIGFFKEEDFDADGNLLSSIPEHTFSKVSPGDIRYEDVNKDGKISEYDVMAMGYSKEYPELYFGLNFGFEYKGFGLNANLQGIAHYTVEPTVSSIYWPLYGNNKTISDHYLNNRWTTETPNAKYPRLTTLSNDNNFRSSSLWMQRGDYLKLRDLELYYKLPNRVINKMRMSECKLFLKGMNLFSLDYIKIMDPEMLSASYPSARTYMIGASVTF